jgi:membrane-associated protease RseP (regulator of RpoE activity)
MKGNENYQEVQEEVEKVKSIVGRHFSIYEVKVSPEVISLYLKVWDQDVSERFEALRLQLKESGYIPFIMHKGGEYVLHVQRKPQVKFRSTKVNLVLLIATIFTTALAGMWNWAAYEGLPWGLESLAKGAGYFAIPLLLILGVHELGHYYMAKRHKVEASLPFFIPFPLSPLGTMGAVISMREPIPNRKALIEIGAAGPIFGLLVALPIATLGIYLTGAVAHPLPANIGDVGGFFFSEPLLYQFIGFFMTNPGNVALHPMAFAGWVGFFVTALNLLPAGQLDGGHIARATLGDNAKYLGYGSLFFLLAVSFVTGYAGWIIIGLLVIFLGVNHPPPLNDITKLDVKRKAMGLGIAAIMVVSFVPVPFDIVDPIYDFEFRDDLDPDVALELENITAQANTNVTYNYTVKNEGNTYANISMKVDENILQILENENWNISFESFNGTDIIYTDTAYVKLNSNESENVTMRIFVPSGAASGGTYTIKIKASMRNLYDQRVRDETLSLDVHIE